MANVWIAVSLVLYLLLVWSNFVGLSAYEAQTSKSTNWSKIIYLILAPLSAIVSLFITLFTGKWPFETMREIRTENETKVWEQALDAATLGVFENPYTNLPAYILATTKAMREEARREAELRENPVHLEGDSGPTDDEVRGMFSAYSGGTHVPNWLGSQGTNKTNVGLLGPIEHLETAAFLLKTDLEKLASPEEKN